jgi:hypothetical protein
MKLPLFIRAAECQEQLVSLGITFRPFEYVLLRSAGILTSLSGHLRKILRCNPFS